MSRRQALWVAFAVLAVAGCSVPLHALATASSGWEQTAALIALLGAACLARVGWLLASAARAVRALRVADASEDLLVAAGAAGVKRLTVVDSEEVLAFCSGLFRPHVVVSSGLATSVSDEVLQAVLVHEAHHARHLEPLRRALGSGVADILLPFPALRWWADRQIEESELAADRAAIARVGEEAVAAALVTVGASTPRVAVAAFGGAADLRAAQLLGEPLAPRAMPLRTLLGSLAGLAVLVAAGICTTQAVG